MALSGNPENFGRMLSSAIQAIKGCEGKSIKSIEDQLGYALKRDGGSAVERWRRGYLPPNLTDVTILAREIIKRSCGRLDRKWLLEFLKSTDYPYPEKLCDELFPTAKLPSQGPPSGVLPGGDTKPSSPSEIKPLTIFQAPGDNADFVGRKSLVKEIIKLLAPGGQIAILNGMGGVGKTTLAAHLAYHLEAFFPKGVLWVSLEKAYTEGKLDEAFIKSLLYDIADHFNVNLGDKPGLAQRSAAVREILTHQQVLIILENAFNSEDVDPFIPSSNSRCAVLITTRNQGKLSSRATVFPLNVFNESESLALLQQISAPERVTAEVKVAQQIVAQLGGLPLALKLAASALDFTEDMSLSEYYELLLDERSLLDNLNEWEDTSKNIRASFALSFNRLTNEQQRLFVSLSVFAPPDFSVEAIAHITDSSPVKARLALARLQQLSLAEVSQLSRVRGSQTDDEQTNTGVGLSRYRLHPLLRLFAQEQAPRIGLDWAELQRRAAVFYIGFAIQHQQDYPRLRLDWNNVYVALQRTKTQSAWNELYQGVAGLTAVNLGVVGFLDTQGFWSEARSFLQSLLDSSLVDTDSLKKAEILFKLATFAFRQTEVSAADAYLKQSLALIENGEGEMPILLHAYALELKASLALHHGQIETALIYLNEGIETLLKLATPRARHETGYLQIRRGMFLARMGNLEDGEISTKDGIDLLPPDPTPARISGLMNLGIFYDMQGKEKDALAIWQEGAQAAEMLGDNRRLAGLQRNMSAAHAKRGRLNDAIPLAEKALALYEQMGDVGGAAHLHSNLGEDYLLLQEYMKAQEHLDIALTLARQRQLGEVEVYTLVNQARWQLDHRQTGKAQTILSQAETLAQRLKLTDQIAEITRLKAEVACQQEAYETALDYIEAALLQTPEPRELGVCWRLKGDILMSLDRPAPAEDAYYHSRDILTDKNAFELARTQLAMGKYYRKQNSLRHGRDLLQEALSTFELLQVEPFVTATRSELGAGHNDALADGLNDMASAVYAPVDISRYVQRQEISRGGQGVVYKGEDAITGRPIVIKYIRPDAEQNSAAQLQQRLKREAEILRQLDHPNIVRCLAAGAKGEEYVVVMEYVPGGTLRDLLFEKSPLPLARVLNIAESLARALAWAHERNIIHRDVKPENVLLATDGTPRLTDFGIARMTQRQTRLTQAGARLGTEWYMSPQAWRGQELDARGDIWSLGVMLFEMVAGRRPFPDRNVQAILNDPIPDLLQLTPESPAPLIDLVERMLQKELENRISPMSQVVTELAVIQQDSGVT